VWNDTRCHDDSGFLPTVSTLQACEAECFISPKCDIFSFCPSRAVAGCDIGPSCWQYAASERSTCTAFPGFTSGAKVPNSTVTTVPLWTAYANATQAQSDAFALYPAWPSQALDLVAAGPAAAVAAQVSSRLYSDFANGRPVDLFPAAVRSSHAAIRTEYAWAPADIITGLQAYLANFFGPNLLPYAPGGGIENIAVAHAVNEMLVASRNGTITLFPAWPASDDAAFAGLLVKGGVSVSASQAGGVVTSPVSVTLTFPPPAAAAAGGQQLRVTNPWAGSGGGVTVNCDGAAPQPAGSGPDLMFWAPVGKVCTVVQGAW